MVCLKVTNSVAKKTEHKHTKRSLCPFIGYSDLGDATKRQYNTELHQNRSSSRYEYW